MRDRSIGDRRQIGRTSRLNTAQELKTLIHWLVGFVVFEIFDLLTNDCRSSEFTDEKRSIIVLIGILFLFFTTKFNIFSSNRVFLF